MNETIRMQLSAYVDGELPDSEAELLLRRLSQDDALREEVAEFLEIGRSMRGESGPAGIHGLRDRIRSAIDSDGTEAQEAEPRQARPTLFKPLAGVAVAAAVAVVAIVGLGQSAGPDGAPAPGVIAEETDYVVPPTDSTMREYFRMHGESTSASGANGIGARLASFELIDVNADAPLSDPVAPPDEALLDDAPDATSGE